MRLCKLPAVTLVCASTLLASWRIAAQEARAGSFSSSLPDNPKPHFAGPPVDVAPSSSGDQTVAIAQNASSVDTSTQPQKTQYQKAEEQIKEQEKQRIAGVVPAFNVTYRSDAVSMSPGQKMRLALRSSTDAVTFAAAALAAGYREALDDDKGFGWGLKGYGKRAGAAYLDAAEGTIVGNGILPSILHQDPRFFRRGHGTVLHRTLYAAASAVICKHDNTGKWEPNYSNVAGNAIAGAISNLYYPDGEAGFGQTIGNAMTVTAEGSIAAIFNEFWPDISRKLLHRDPTYGRDAGARALDKEAKDARR